MCFSELDLSGSGCKTKRSIVFTILSTCKVCGNELEFKLGSLNPSKYHLDSADHMNVFLESVMLVLLGLGRHQSERANVS